MLPLKMNGSFCDEVISGFKLSRGVAKLFLLSYENVFPLPKNVDMIF